MKKNHTILVIIVLLFFINMSLSGCSWLKLSRDCSNINIESVEKVINTLENKGEIRHDQAMARKKSIRKSWSEYLNGQLTCEELCKKAHYHTDGIFSCQ